MPGKDFFRKKALSQRQKLKSSLYRRFSRRIQNHLALYLAEQKPLDILLYFPHLKEPDLMPLIACLPEHRFYLPLCQKEGIAICPCRIDTPLIPGRFGIPVPDSLPESRYPDLILAPCVALDKKGQRLGYGKGYYDQFLKHSSGLRIGVLFSPQLFTSLPFEAHDQKMDGVLTENGLHWFKKPSAL